MTHYYGYAHAPEPSPSSKDSSSASSESQSEKTSEIETKIVKVQTKSSSHPYFGQGSAKGYFIDGKESPSLTLRQNVVYRFDQSDSSNSNHRILFFTDVNKLNSYQTSSSGIVGTTGAYTEITLKSSSPVEIFYQCQNHPLMGSNIYSSTSGNDLLTSSSNNELIDGGSGIDTVTFSGKFSDYSITRNSTSLLLNDKRIGANDGADTLSNIEYIQFSDQTVEESQVDIVKTYDGKFSDYQFYNKGDGVYQIKSDSGYDDITGIPSLTFTGEATTSSFRDISSIVDIKGTFDQVTGLNTDDAKMFRLYSAAFSRLPDPDGLNYWISKYTSGEDDDRAVAQSFLASDEFSERYGTNLSNAKYVETLYVNVLGRDYDQVGYTYWLGNLNSGLETRHEVLLGFSESVENKTLFTEMTGFV